MAGWQDAVGVLARERELAESGAGLLKAYAGRDAAAMARGQQLYAAAKAASDGLIERLLVAVREGDDPGRSADLEAAMGEAVERRVGFSRHVERHLPQAEGTRAVAIAAFLGALAGAKPAAEAVKALAEAAATLWKTWREGRELDRQAIAARLAAQKWRAFVDVPEAR
jgi:hypothetical protein